MAVGALALLVPLPVRATPGLPRVDRVEAPHIAVALVTDTETVRPGRPLQVGVRFVLERGWHVYWQNPGDSGEPPKVTWHLSPAAPVGALAWPRPERLPAGPLVNFGYERDVLLSAPVATAGLDAVRALTITAEVTWLVCQEECIPGRATLTKDLRVGSVPGAPVVPSAAASLFAEAQAAGPVPCPGVRASFVAPRLTLHVPRTCAGDVARAEVFLSQGGLGELSVPALVRPPGPGGDLAVVVTTSVNAAPDARVSGVVTWGASRALAFDAPVERPLTPPDTPAPSSSAAGMGFLVALALAFAGGCLLNLMPCVFPVLSLKLFAVARHGAGREARRQAWGYAAGVLVSFWALAGVLLGVRAAGVRLGWGFQLQSPVFVCALCALLLAIALNLAGVFEVGLALTRIGGWLRPAQAAAGREGVGGSFATGLLATAVATPCTAPFMSGALGYAVAKPPAVAFAVFTALGAGLAAPYVLLAHNERLLRALPRPGAWMDVLKQALAFPVLGTLLWLLAVANDLIGSLGTFALLGALLLLAFGAWVGGTWQRSAGHPWWGLAAAVAAIGAALVVGWKASALRPSSPPGPNASEASAWSPWSPERVQAAFGEGRPVFVDFTAAWCISCQVNERVVLARAAVRDAFARHGVVALKADFTTHDERIARELEAHGRIGVPLYLAYPAGASVATVLPAVITPGAVLEALRLPP